MQDETGQKTYQITSLSPDVIDRIVVDDSPTILYDEFWAFLGVDIPIANIQEHDFKIIRLMVRRQILNILERYKEDEWDKIMIVEYEYIPQKDDDGNLVMNGDKPVLIKRQKAVYRLVELINSLDSKVYVKLCRARDGFTLNSLTVERQQIKQDVSDNRPVILPQQPLQQQEQGNTWGI